MKPILGGFVTCRPKPIDLKIGGEQGLTLMSDLHIGAPNVNYRLIERELRNARKRGDRVLINGDVFDGILHSDAKRFTPDSIHPRLAGRRDVLNGAIEWATEILAPYADLIDVIGVGNHETALEKHHSIDPVRVLLYELSRDKRWKHGSIPRDCKGRLKKTDDHVIHYGGYCGFVDYRVGRCRWVLYYHHGSGGSSYGNKGVADYGKKSTFVDADCIWMGHKHNRWNAHVQRISCPMSGQGPLIRDVRYVMTGAYMHTYTGQSQLSLKKHGRRTNYAADLGCPPQGQGGARVVLKRVRDGLEARVEQ